MVRNQLACQFCSDLVIWDIGDVEWMGYILSDTAAGNRMKWVGCEECEGL